MDYSTTHKFVIAVNKVLEPGVAMNAVAHSALGLVAKATKEDQSAMQFVSYIDGDGKEHPFISSLSLIILRATASELRKFYKEAHLNGMLVQDFLSTMTGGTWIEQIEKTKLAGGDSLIPYTVACFGKKGIIDPLTKRMSLWK